MQTLDSFKTHARKFGTEAVMETAAKKLTFEQLVELQTLCDELDRAKVRFPRKTRLTAEQKVKKLLGPTEEGAKP